jgi:hypothetical protein
VVGAVSQLSSGGDYRYLIPVVLQGWRLSKHGETVTLLVKAKSPFTVFFDFFSRTKWIKLEVVAATEGD